MKIFPFLTLFFFLHTASFAQETLFSFSSQKISEKNHSLFLSDDVKIQIEKNFFSSQQAFLDFFSDKSKIKKPQKISLREHVKAIFPEQNFTIESDVASFDLEQRHLFFSSDEKILATCLMGKNHLKFQGKTAECFLQTLPKKQLSLDLFSKISIEHGVEFCLNQTLHGSGEKMLFIPPLLTLYPEKELCSISNLKNTLLASEIQYNLTTSEWFCKNPSGIIFPPSLPPNSPIKFSAKEFFGSEDLKKISLKGDVLLETEKPKGTLHADSLQFTQSQKPIQQLLTEGQTEFFFSQKDSFLKFSSFGPVFLDSEKKALFFQSPKASSDQLILENNQMRFFANEASLFYTSSKKIEKITLQKEIRFLFFLSPENPICGIADEASYDPKTKTSTLRSFAGKKVLLKKKDGSLQIRANEISIRQDPVTKKEIILGNGPVQCFLTVEEDSILNEILSKYLRTTSP